jgi:hypothetical protein
VFQNSSTSKVNALDISIDEIVSFTARDHSHRATTSVLQVRRNGEDFAGAAAISKEKMQARYPAEYSSEAVRT